MKTKKPLIFTIIAGVITVATITLFSSQANALNVNCTVTVDGESFSCVGPVPTICFSFEGPDGYIDCKGIKISEFHPDDPE